MSVAARKVPFDHDEQVANLVHDRTAVPDTAALVALVVQAMSRVVHKSLPVSDGVLDLSRPEAGVFQSRDDFPPEG